MVRIIPWKLPDVQGGSVGGYTPAPTPEPLTNYPYDLDNMVLSAEYVTDKFTAAGYRKTTVKGVVNISGVVILDASSVSSVIATVAVTPGTVVWADDLSHYSLNEATLDVDISSIMSNVGGSVEVTNGTEDSQKYLKNFRAIAYDNQPNYPTLVTNECTIEVTMIKVYNSNGVVIQEWTPPEE